MSQLTICPNRMLGFVFSVVTRVAQKQYSYGDTLKPPHTKRGGRSSWKKGATWSDKLPAKPAQRTHTAGFHGLKLEKVKTRQQ